jgi:hypothetical protein
MDGPLPQEKALNTAACQQFIDDVLKPRFLRVVRPTEFNYPVDIPGKWHGAQPVEMSALHMGANVCLWRSPAKCVATRQVKTVASRKPQARIYSIVFKGIF